VLICGHCQGLLLHLRITFDPSQWWTLISVALSASIHCLICYSFGSRSRAYAKDGGRESPGRRVTFFRLLDKKVTKERATLLSATPSLRCGATWGARSRGAPQNSLRAFGAPLGQLR
ncbi:hypothetical protein, partial [Acidovorax sp. HMWF018]|uniref:hypothetical protein n=1 Tax=Acidovorax sp. HMWF018 TaxID=2056855 RepID=UPI001E47B0B3